MIEMKIALFVVAAFVLQVAVSNPASYHKQLTPEETKRLAAWTPKSKQRMWQLSGQYQGDIVLAPGQRNGVIDTSLRWPNNEIPYAFSSDFSMEYNFDKYGADEITSFGEEYDYDSVMHYDEYAFSANGGRTIIPKDPNAVIGQDDGLSATDIVKLDKMYNCA